MSNKSTSIIAFVALFLAVFDLVFRHVVIAATDAGVVVQGLAVVFMIWARVTFGVRSFHAAANPTEGGLVTSGHFHFVRHPIYLSVIVFVWATVVTRVSFHNVAIGVIVAGCSIIRLHFEEKLVSVKYPEYAEYAKRTKRLIPFIY